jgi:hypothetical protein
MNLKNVTSKKAARCFRDYLKYCVYIVKQFTTTKTETKERLARLGLKQASYSGICGRNWEIPGIPQSRGPT